MANNESDKQYLLTELIEDFPGRREPRPPRVQPKRVPLKQGGAEPSARDVADPLNESTRKERKTLLAVALVALAITFGNLVPTHVQALGIALDAPERSAILFLLAGCLLYLLVGFAIYTKADFVAWEADLAAFVRNKGVAIREKLNEGRLEDRLVDEREVKEILDREWPHRRISRVRKAFEFGVPLAIGICALVVVLAKAVRLF